MFKKQRRKRKKINKKMIWINIGLSISVIFLVFFYIVQIANTSKQGFRITELEKKINRYNEDIARLDDRIKKTKTTEYIMAEAKRMEMVSVDKYDFLAPVSSGVALNK